MDSNASNRNFAVEGQSRRDFLIEFHKPLQKNILFVGGPVAFVIFFYWNWVFPSWQSVVLLISECLLSASWYCGYRFGKQDKLTASVFCFALPASIQGAIAILLLDGFEVAVLWAMFAGTMYAGLFDSRPLYICIGISIVAPTFAAIVKYLDLYQRVVVPSEYLFLPTAGMTLLSGSFIMYFIIRSQGISGRMFRSLDVANQDQQEIIVTVEQILPEINDALQRIQRTSTKVAFQSSQLTTATSEISVTMNGVNKKAIETANTARETSSVAESTHDISQRNFGLFRSVDDGFQQGIKMISDAAFEVTNLASQMEHIEEILSINRQIGEQITLLAINATIEADEAGSYGKVFGEIAREFRTMIRDTEKNLTQSRSLLHAIRNQVRESSLTLVDGSKKLKLNYEDLRTTGTIVEENIHRFYLTAEQLAEIHEAAKRQQHNVQEVSSAMAEIDRTTVDLSKSAAALEENVARIGSSGKRLGDILQLLDTV